MYFLIKSFSFDFLVFFFNDTATTEIYTLSLHDALPISACSPGCSRGLRGPACLSAPLRSEEHTSELQSRRDLVCRLLLEKKNSKNITNPSKKTRIPHLPIRFILRDV